jgi:hypothetical protein
MACILGILGAQVSDFPAGWIAPYRMSNPGDIPLSHLKKALNALLCASANTQTRRLNKKRQPEGWRSILPFSPGVGCSPKPG